MQRALRSWIGDMSARQGPLFPVLPPARRAIARIMGFLERRHLARSVNRALSGRVANLGDIEAFIRAHPVRLRAPLVLVSQAQRCGGTLLSQLFDGHPALAAHPQELKIGYPTAHDWPPLDPGLGPDKNFRMMFESNTVSLMRRGYTKGDRDPERRRFFMVPRVQYGVFEQLFETAPPASRREILDLFFTSYFNAWLNYQGSLEEKRWITAFAPRLAHQEPSVAGFFDSYPDGRLVQLVRDPRTWYPSAKNNPKSGLAGKAPEEILDMWCTSAESIRRNKSGYPDRVIVLRFEDLVGRTAQTMRELARELDIAYDPILIQPTFNGRPMRANSSFAVEGPGVIDAPLARERMLSDDERRLIERRCLALYERVVADAAMIPA